MLSLSHEGGGGIQPLPLQHPSTSLSSQQQPIEAQWTLHHSERCQPSIAGEDSRLFVLSEQLLYIAKSSN